MGMFNVMMNNGKATVFSFYQPPAWAQLLPQHIRSSEKEKGAASESTSWTLLEIKAGVQVTEHALGGTRSCTVFGRRIIDNDREEDEEVEKDNDTADSKDNKVVNFDFIALAHASISRLHARIAWDANGTCWLRDLGSTHGTFVNRRRLPAVASGRIESTSSIAGSRGVVLHTGDIIQFGASTRLFCVQGPTQTPAARIDNATTSPTQQQLLKPNPSSFPMQAQHRDDEGRVSNNVMEGDPWDNHADDAYDAENDLPKREDEFLLTEDMIQQQHPHHRKAWDHIQALQYKVNNMEIENSRIQRKGGDLSVGQERQLERNESRIAQLRTDITEKRRALWQQIHRPASIQSSRQSAKHVRSDDDDNENDDDDVEDRTGTMQHSMHQFDDKGETEKSLTKKYDEISTRLQHLEPNRFKLSHNAASIQDRITLVTADGGNHEDAFFLENELDLMNDKLRKLDRDKRGLEASLQSVVRLLKIANPRWTQPFTVTIQPNHFKDSTTTMTSARMSQQPPRDREALPVSRSDQNLCIAPGSTSGAAIETDKLNKPPRSIDGSTDSFFVTTTSDLQSAVKRRRVMGPCLPPPSSSPKDGERTSDGFVIPRTPSSTSVHSTKHQPKPVSSSSSSLAVRNTLAALAHTSSSSAPPSFLPPNHHGPSAASSIVAKNTNGVSMLQQQDEWRPPKDQDGSGMTALNSKFAGRY